MRVLLTAPSPLFSQLNQRAPTSALYALAAVVRRAGHDVELVDHPDVDARLEESGNALLPPIRASHFLTHHEIRLLDEAVASRLEFPGISAAAERSDCVGVSANSLNWLYARRMIHEIRRISPRATIVVGGPHPTFCPDEVLRRSDADIAVRGEGEVTFPVLLDALSTHKSLSDVSGISFKLNGEVVHNPDRPVLSSDELEAVPLPAWELLAPGRFEVIGLEASRGCPFQCRFCSIPHRGSWRGLSAPEVLRRVAFAGLHLHRLRPNGTGRREILFVDDNFTTDARRCTEILEALPSTGGRECEFSLEGRAADVAHHPELVRSLARVPLHRFLCGIESGSDRGLRAIRKALTVAQVDRCSGLLADAGLGDRVRYSFILGMPWDTKADCFDTVDFMFRTATRFGITCQGSWYGIFPGSEIWTSRSEYGIDLDASVFETHFARSRDIFLHVTNRLSPQDVRDVVARHRANILLASLAREAGTIVDILDLESEPQGLVA